MANNHYGPFDLEHLFFGEKKNFVMHFIIMSYTDAVIVLFVHFQYSILNFNCYSGA